VFSRTRLNVAERTPSARNTVLRYEATAAAQTQTSTA
jgi:hypothetical protein